MSATTTKRKRDEDDNEGPPNKKIKTEATSQSNRPSVELMPELWLHILVFISYRNIGPIRLVCRQWNEMTHSKDYGKALCIRKFGHDIGPLKITNLASLSKVADSDLVLIPTIQDESRLSVDWLTYYEARRLLRRCIRELSEDGYSEKLSEKADLTYSTILEIMQIAFNYELYKFSPVIDVFLKVTPLLVQYKREELAYELVALLAVSEADAYDTPKHIHQLLDIYDLSPHFAADRSYYIFGLACNASRIFYHAPQRASPKKLKRSLIFCERIFPRLLQTIVQRGSQPLEAMHDIKSIVEPKESHPRYNFPIIFDVADNPVVIGGQLVNTLHSLIIPICRTEYELTDDWCVKESALLAPCISTCRHSDYGHDCVKFALEALYDKQAHKRVLQAAVILLYSKLMHNVVKLSQDEFDLVFEHLIWVSDKVEPNYQLTIVDGLIELLTLPEFSALVSEDKLDLFHATLFKVVFIPGVLSDSIIDELDMFDVRIHHFAETFGQRLRKYLPQYRENFFKVASNDEKFLGSLTPVDLVSCYLEIGSFIDPENFNEETNEIVKKVQERTIGFEVNVAEFYVRSTMESLSTPGVNPRVLIESILKLYPKVVIQPLHNNDKKDEETSEENEEQNIGEEFPDYIPHFKHQYDETISQRHQIDSSEWPKLFNFSTTAKRSLKPTYQPELVPVENFQMDLVDNMVALDGIESLVDIYTKDPDNKKMLKEYVPIFLSVIINCMRMELQIWRAWVFGARILLQEISENFPFDIMACYLTALLDALSSEEDEDLFEPSTFEPEDEMKKLEDFIHHIIMSKFTDPPANLLSKYFDMLFCFDRPHNKYWLDRLKALEDIILKWPRTTWIALCNASVADQLLLDDYTHTDPKEDRVGRYLVWQLLMKYYGYKRVAALISHLKEIDVTQFDVDYFYAHLICCLKGLEEGYLDPNLKELQYHAKQTLSKFADFCRLYHIDKNAGDVCFFNQFITDQSNIGQILNTINPELVIEELSGNYFSLFF